MAKMKIKVYGPDKVLDKVEEAVKGLYYKYKRTEGKLKIKVQGNVSDCAAVADTVTAITPANKAKFD